MFDVKDQSASVNIEDGRDFLREKLEGLPEEFSITTTRVAQIAGYDRTAWNRSVKSGTVKVDALLRLSLVLGFSMSDFFSPPARRSYLTDLAVGRINNLTPLQRNMIVESVEEDGGQDLCQALKLLNTFKKMRVKTSDVLILCEALSARDPKTQSRIFSVITRFVTEADP
ncbi:MAG: hypothetical protein ACK42D_01225 [Candidatus Paceibacteria bacterium]